jgi:hypothetical protein
MVGSGGILAVPSSGGQSRMVTTPDSARGERRQLQPQFLPGGRRFLYVAGSNKTGGGTLYAGSLDASLGIGARTAILNVDSTVMFVPLRRGGAAGYLVFERAGALMAQPFDSATLRITGEAVAVAGPIVKGAALSATAIAIPAVSATPSTLVYQSVSVSPIHLTALDISGNGVRNAAKGGLIAMENWMTALAH